MPNNQSIVEFGNVVYRPRPVGGGQAIDRIEGPSVVGQQVGPSVANVPHEFNWDAYYARKARDAFKQRWLATGGATSPLGLPVDPSFPVMKSGDNAYNCEFRGGQLRFNSNDGSIEQSAMNHVVVTFEGFGLEMRQEDGDEIYGSVNVQIGTTGFKQDFVVPEQNLGPSGNNRIAQLGITLYEGPPVDLNILLTLVEHDSGDRATVRNDVKNRFKQIFQQAEAAASAGAAAAGASGSALKALQAESASSSDLKTWLIEETGGLIADVLGMGDDPYNPVGFTIPSAEMLNIPPLRQYRCSSDPKLLNWTHSRMSTCRDDADDIGQISALFRVRPK